MFKHIVYYTKVILITLYLPACTQVSSNAELISWKTNFYMSDGDSATKFYKDYDKFKREHMKAIFENDTIYATSIKEQNTCSEKIAAIRISNDTLFLAREDNSKYACTSVEFIQYSYVIHNPTRKKYIIKSEY